MRLKSLAAALMLGTGAPALAGTTVIHADHVVTDADAPVRGQSSVIVTDGRIVSIEDGFIDGPAGAEIVHLAGKTLVPGLTDLHVHLTGDPGGEFWREATEPDDWGVVVGAKNALITAKAGFTTVREAGSARATAFSLRRGTAEGLIPGPRIVAAGPGIRIPFDVDPQRFVVERRADDDFFGDVVPVSVFDDVGAGFVDRQLQFADVFAVEPGLQADAADELPDKRQIFRRGRNL